MSKSTSTRLGPAGRLPGFATMLAACAVLAVPMTASAQDLKGPMLPGQELKPAGGPGVASSAEDFPLKFDKLVHDWGRVTDEAELEHIFRFTNESNTTVIIHNVGSTCGCTVPQLTKKIYDPGESGEIIARFNPTNRRGPNTKNVNITLTPDESGVQRRLDLTLHSYVLPMVWVEPNRAYFADVFKGTGGSQEVIITARRPDFEIASVEGHNEAFTARIVKTEQVEEEGDQITKVTVIVDLNPEAGIGTHNTQFTFHSNEPKWPQFKMFATGVVVGELRTDPPSAVIRTQQPNTAFESMVIVESRNAVPFDITDLDFTVEGNVDLNLVVDYESYEHTRGRPTYLVRISGVTPPNPGQIRANIKISTNLPDQEQASVVLWGTVRNDQGMPAQLPVQTSQMTSSPANAQKIPLPTDVKPVPRPTEDPGSR